MLRITGSRILGLLTMVALTPIAEATAPKQVCFLHLPLRYIAENKGQTLPEAVQVRVTVNYKNTGSIGPESEIETRLLEPHPFRNGGQFFSEDLDRTYVSLMAERQLQSVHIEAEALFPDGISRFLESTDTFIQTEKTAPLRCEEHI